MFDLMDEHASLWTICLSHTIGRAVAGMVTKAPIFGIDKEKFNEPDSFVKEARKTRKIPNSAPKGESKTPL